MDQDVYMDASSMQGIQLGINSSPEVTCRLEALPPEIRTEILWELAFDALKALVRASPTYHAQYLIDREALFCEAVRDMLGSTLAEAKAKYLSGKDEYQNNYSSDKTGQINKAYRKFRKASILGPLPLTMDEAIGIAQFHCSIVNPIAQNYIKWMLGNLAKKNNSQYDSQPLSKTEKARLLRALYRFQLCCDLYWQADAELWGNPFSVGDHASIFLADFQPWETEGISCILLFVEETYRRIFRDIWWDLKPANPAYDHAVRPGLKFDLEDGGRKDGSLQGAVSRGLRLLHSVSRKLTTYGEVVPEMRKNLVLEIHENLVHNETCCLDVDFGALSDMCQMLLHRLWPKLSQYARHRAQEPMPFVGDREPDAAGRPPPLAWTIIWKETYSCLYGYYTLGPFRRWGYVFWDARRMRRNGAVTLLREQWHIWTKGGRDPRDDVHWPRIVDIDETVFDDIDEIDSDDIDEIDFDDIDEIDIE